MRTPATRTRMATWLAGGLAFSAIAYGTSVAATWLRYGRFQRQPPGGSLLDKFMPSCDVVERHETFVNAPSNTTFDAACSVDFGRAAIPRVLFNIREIVMRGAARNEPAMTGSGILAQAQAIGWGVLSNVPGREIIFGAVTQPWVAEPVFRALPPNEFMAFQEPGYVKIAWTLSAREAGSETSVALTETRAVATDADARSRFRWYWSLVRPGVVLIRWSLLRAVKSEAERRVQG
jgi:hypothetical protein